MQLSSSRQFTRIISIMRLRPFDTATEGGRSKERFRRAAMTTIAAGVAKAISLLTSLVSVPLTYRYLGGERYGIWMVLTSIIAVMGFADLGIGNGLVNSISEAYGKDDRRLAKEYLTSALFTLLGIAALFAVAGAVAYPFLPWLRLFNVKSTGVAAEGAKAFLVLYGWFVINIPLGVVTRAQTGLQQGYSSAIIGSIGNIASLLAMLLVIAWHGNLAWLVFASTFGVVAATLGNGWLLFGKNPWLLPSRHAYSKHAAHKILKLGLLFFVLQCSYAVSFSSDNIVIAQVMGAAAVAVYAVPQKLFSFVSMVIGIAVGPLWPAYGEALARGDVAWMRRVFLGSLWLTLIISVPLCTLLALSGPWILRVAVGKSLHAPMSLLVVLAVWGIVSSVSSVASMLLNGAGILKEQAILSVIVGVSNVALSIFLTFRFGVIGVCLGSIIVQLLVTFPTYSVLIPRLFTRLARAKTKNALPGVKYTPQAE